MKIAFKLKENISTRKFQNNCMFKMINLCIVQQRDADAGGMMVNKRQTKKSEKENCINIRQQNGSSKYLKYFCAKSTIIIIIETSFDVDGIGLHICPQFPLLILNYISQCHSFSRFWQGPITSHLFQYEICLS